MFEEQGRGLLKGAARKFFGWMLSVMKNGLVHLENKAAQGKSETGRKSVKNLVRKGRDLELSEAINDSRILKDVCKQAKKQGLAFAIKKEKDGSFRILYQRKDATLVNLAMQKAFMKDLKPKRSLSEILNRNKQLVNDNKDIHTPLKHREVGTR